jgi:glycosyltransferase involved in cell wall biosynthesis
MRILMAHNRIASSAPTGENVVVDAERDLLRSRGHQVEMFERDNSQLRRRGALGAVHGAVASPWNPFAARALRRAVDAFKPHVVHVHNTFPLLSPAVFPALDRRVPRVLTLHNYAIFCAGGLPLREGAPCTLCLDRRSVGPALRFGCYRGSRVATAPRAAAVALHRWLGTWESQVEAFIVLTRFQRDRLVEAGLPAVRVHVKPNFFPGRPVAEPWAKRERYVVFVGRLTREKGAATLVEAWRLWGDAAPELRIVGDGADRPALEAAGLGTRVRFLGQLDTAETFRQIARSCLVVIPSIVWEGFPLVLREAFAFGTPAAVSDVGPLPSIVEDGRRGLIFRGGDAASLLNTVRGAWTSDGVLAELGRRGREAYEQEYTEEAGYAALLRVYRAAMDIFEERTKA